MYELWLGGTAIRKIGKRYGLGRMRVWSILNRHYGKGATAPRKQSLARTVYREYGDLETATKARGIEGLFRSGRTENNYSKWQTVEFKTTPTLAHHVDSQGVYLNLMFYRKVADLTAHLLYLTIWNHINRHSLTI